MPDSEASLAAAWSRFRDRIEELRADVLADERCGLSAMAEAQAYNYLLQLQATAYNMAVAPRSDFPRFNTQQLFEPIYGWLAPNPDFIYSRTILNPRRSWKITGRLGDAVMMVFQVQSRLFAYDMKRIGDYEKEAFEYGADGSFEIIASAEKPAQGNWIRLSPELEHNVISVRRALPAFDIDVGVIAIEPLDGAAEQPYEREPAELVPQIDYACEMADFTTRKITLELYHKTLANAGWNQPWVWGNERSGGAAIGGAELATYGFILYDLADDEAMVVEMEVPDCLYWGAQLNDVWWQTVEYGWHQSSLSMGQAVRDADGRVRYVLCGSDTGHANWLDTVGNRQGCLILRWYDAEHRPEVKVAVVKKDKVDDHLPAGTARVSSDQRRISLTARAKDVYRIYGT
jgi:hypothetical protein